MDTSIGGVAVVTGAGSGIGAEIASQLARRGATVGVNDLETGKATAVADAIVAEGGIAFAVPGDVSTRAGARTVLDAAEAVGDLDILVNNVGIVRDNALRRMTDEEWDLVLDVNLKSPFLCTQAAAVGMIERGYGRIVNITSRAWLGSIGQANYSSSKGGVVSLTRSCALELARAGITVNCVAPGLIDTPLIRSLDETIQQRLIEAQPTRTMGTPADVAAATCFLASREAGFITGQVLYVCGGKSLGAVF